jgi:H+/gluconate symporter-like permease
MSIFGIILSLALFMLLAYRGVNVIVLAPMMAVVALLFDPGTLVLASYTQIFMPALGRFVANYFPLFVLGSIFGKLLDETGSTAAIAHRVVALLGVHRSLWAVVLSCALLTYGGVSVFVVVFAVFPLGQALLRRADIPMRLLPGAIALGSFTFSMTTAPGSLQMHNLIPMKFFQTTAFAAPLLGLVGSVVMLGLGMAWLTMRARAAARAGEGFGVAEDGRARDDVPGSMPSFAIAILPVVAVISLNYVLTEHLIPRWNTGYLAEPPFGPTSIDAVRGIWATILALLLASAILVLLRFRSLGQLVKTLTAGTTSSLAPIFNTASEVGYGATVASLTGFAALKNALLGIAPSNPLISESICVNLLAGITGSASGGLTIALEALGPTFLERGVAAGISPEVMHRIAAMSCCGLDTLPHNGAVVTLLLICGLTHWQSYLDIFVVSVLGPIVATVTVLVLATTLGSA